MKNLSCLELRMLRYLWTSSRGNGHDFALLCVDAPLGREQSRAVITNLQRDGWISDYSPNHPEDGASPSVLATIVLSPECVSLIERMQAVADKVGLREPKRTIFALYYVARHSHYGDQTGYAEEWARRFLDGIAWRKADLEGRNYLTELGIYAD